MSAWPQIGPFRLLDKSPLTLTTPLGLRFCDGATGKTVEEGLQVTGYPEEQPAQRRQAVMTRSGVWAFIRLPGLRDFENGKGDADFWNQQTTAYSLVVEVMDTQRRFLPVRFTVDVPHHRVYEGEDLFPVPPPRRCAGIPLFSAPSRVVPVGLAVLRADLREPSASDDPPPAAWVYVVVQYKGTVLARGMSNEFGQLVLTFPYPRAEANPLTTGAAISPSGSSRIALREQEWELQLEMRYAGLRPPPPLPGLEALPNLQAVTTQPQTEVWEALSPLRRLEVVTLRFGEELILPLRDVATGQRATLLISPAGSPP